MAANEEDDEQERGRNAHEPGEQIAEASFFGREDFLHERMGVFHNDLLYEGFHRGGKASAVPGQIAQGLKGQGVLRIAHEQGVH